MVVFIEIHEQTFLAGRDDLRSPVAVQIRDGEMDAEIIVIESGKQTAELEGSLTTYPAVMCCGFPRKHHTRNGLIPTTRCDPPF